MRIVFFGTSHGLPEPNKRCSSTMIEIGDRRYFIDMGTQSIEQLATRNIFPESIKGIFVTHMHGDHTNGLLSFLDLCSWHYKNTNPHIFLPNPLEDTVTAISAWLKCNGTTLRDFSFTAVKAGVIYADEAIRVTAYRTKHNQMSHAFLIEAEGKRVLFTGDLGAPRIDFPTSVLQEPLDLAVCECAHFTDEAYLPIFKDCKNLNEYLECSQNERRTVKHPRHLCHRWYGNYFVSKKDLLHSRSFSF